MLSRGNLTARSCKSKVICTACRVTGFPNCLALRRTKTSIRSSPGACASVPVRSGSGVKKKRSLAMALRASNKAMISAK